MSSLKHFCGNHVSDFMCWPMKLVLHIFTLFKKAIRVIDKISVKLQNNFTLIRAVGSSQSITSNFWRSIHAFAKPADIEFLQGKVMRLVEQQVG